MSLDHITLSVLVIIFLGAEVFRIFRGIRGVILAVGEVGYDSEVFPVVTAKIRLRDGNVVDASLNQCTACIGQLKVGDEVLVTNSREGYIVDLPWFRGKICKR